MKSKYTNGAPNSQCPLYFKYQFQLLWDKDYYDRPISGILRLHTDHRKYFFHTGEGPQTRVSNYLIYSLTDEEIWWEDYWHDRFVKFVGNHTTYKDSSVPTYSFTHPKDKWPFFYEYYNHWEEIVKPDYAKPERLKGWFKY